MKIRLQQVGQFTCVPLPGAVVKAPGFQPGDQVEVKFDSDSRTVRIRPAGAEEAPEVSQDFPTTVEELIQRHEAVLRDLAKL